jgi:hypothetical protein
MNAHSGSLTPDSNHRKKAGPRAPGRRLAPQIRQSPTFRPSGGEERSAALSHQREVRRPRGFWLALRGILRGTTVGRHPLAPIRRASWTADSAQISPIQGFVLIQPGCSLLAADDYAGLHGGHKCISPANPGCCKFRVFLALGVPGRKYLASARDSVPGRNTLLGGEERA